MGEAIGLVEEGHDADRLLAIVKNGAFHKAPADGVGAGLAAAE